MSLKLKDMFQMFLILSKLIFIAKDRPYGMIIKEKKE